jgi:uncharacterized protein
MFVMMEDGAIGLLVLLGTLTGFISGMLGIGGGTVVVPALVIGLPFLGIDGPDLPKIAVATSLALVVPTSIASAQAHAAKGGIDWRMLFLLAPSIVAGALLTAVFAAAINAHLVMLVFILFALFSAWGLIRPRKTQQLHAKKPRLITVATKGAVGGTLSALLGLGVGFFCVPLLSRFLAMPRAIGTAAALALPMSIVGTTGYLLATSPAGCTGQCMGYVFLPAVAAIGISAVLAAPMGAWAAHVMPVVALRRAFAVFLLFAAANLAYKTFTPTIIAEEGHRIAALAEWLMSPTPDTKRETLATHGEASVSTMAIKLEPEKLIRAALNGVSQHFAALSEVRCVASLTCLRSIKQVLRMDDTERTASIPADAKRHLEITRSQFKTIFDWGKTRANDAQAMSVRLLDDGLRLLSQAQINAVAVAVATVPEEPHVRVVLPQSIEATRAADHLRLMWWRNTPSMRPVFAYGRRFKSKFFVPQYEQGLRQIQH